MGVPPISTYGGEVDSLYRLILIVTGVAFVITEAVLLYFLIRYRHRKENKALYVHGNRRIELIWTIIPGLMFFSLAIYQTSAWRHIKSELPAESESLVIAIEGEQFKWFPTYPGPDGQLATADDITAPENVIHVPVNQKVIVHLSSRDVLHSFFVPALRLKQDAVPGRPISLWFEATQTGEFEIACAELCGLGHYRMRAFLTVEEAADFDAWLAEIGSR
jgi:cytochrome c oxidase subunit II